MDPLTELVHRMLLQIPEGRVTTYGAMARALGDPIAARTIARILSKNRDPSLPCYKVVMGDGSLGGYAFGGPAEKKRRLEGEGIRVVNGKVDLRKYMFEGFDVPPPILRRMAEAQERIAERNKPLEVEVECVVGVDVAYNEGWGVGVAVVFDGQGNIVDKNWWVGRVRFPYVPTYLAFREAPFMVKASEKFRDCLLLVDGHGIAHPRRCGEAVHVGAVLRMPSIGVAKRPLMRDHEKIKGSYPSPGWGLPPIDLLNRFWFGGRRQPEPLEEAHRLATRLRASLSRE